MKKLLLLAASLMVMFAVLLPFASKTLDGLQKLTADAAVEQSVWGGLMANYSIALGDSYVSTLAAGLLGTGIVLLAGFALGSVASRDKREAAA